MLFPTDEEAAAACVAALLPDGVMVSFVVAGAARESWHVVCEREAGPPKTGRAPPPGALPVAAGPQPLDCEGSFLLSLLHHPEAEELEGGGEPHPGASKGNGIRHGLIVAGTGAW